jgi:aldehyde:ferredoxin oxidoreductase
VDPQEWKGKAKYTAKWQDLFAIIDAAGLCVFFSIRNLVEPDLMVPPTGILELLNAATGAGYTLEELEMAGERIINAEKVWLGRAGFDRAQDTLPDRITKEPLPEGPAKGQVCHLEEMLEEYYDLRGWDEKGLVGEAKLKELGLNER